MFMIYGTGTVIYKTSLIVFVEAVSTDCVYTIFIKLGNEIFGVRLKNYFATYRPVD